MSFGFSNPLADTFSNLVESSCDALGLPEPVGDIASGVTNYATGNYGGIANDVADLCGFDGGVMEALGAVLPSDAEALLGVMGGGMGVAPPPGMGAPATAAGASPLEQLLQQLVSAAVAQGGVQV